MNTNNAGKVLTTGKLFIKILIFLAEDKIKDRLAQLAREKLGILSKEKQLQLERKRRAMAFLNQISSKLVPHNVFMDELNKI